MDRGEDEALLDQPTFAILSALAEALGAEVSLPRLAKRLGSSASTVLRHLNMLSPSPIGGRAGPGWLTVTQHEGRWMCTLLPAGSARLARHHAADTDAKDIRT